MELERIKCMCMYMDLVAEPVCEDQNLCCIHTSDGWMGEVGDCGAGKVEG
jgi:hypothetical protein